MPTLTLSDAKERLEGMVDDAVENHCGYCIVGKRNQAVLISMEDWNAIQETLYLNSFPGLAESIKSGMSTPASECSEALEW
jgi:prevent-host-death family protein